MFREDQEKRCGLRPKLGILSRFFPLLYRCAFYTVVIVSHFSFNSVFIFFNSVFTITHQTFFGVIIELHTLAMFLYSDYQTQWGRKIVLKSHFYSDANQVVIFIQFATIIILPPFLEHI